MLESTATRTRIGVGFAQGHHGELLQGMFADATGRLRRALVTLPAPDRGSRAVFHPASGTGGWSARRG